MKTFITGGIDMLTDYPGLSLAREETLLNIEGKSRKS